MRIDDGALDAADQAAFDDWLRGDVRRLGAFARAKAVLVHVKRAKALGPDFEPGTFLPSGEAAAPAEPDADAPAVAGVTRRRMLMGGAAVAAAGAVAFFFPGRQASALVYETARGEARLVPLADGATVTLNTDSRILVSHGQAGPTVRLDRGEALFKIASAGGAPVMVRADDVSVRAAHATFALCRLDAQPLRLSVCEGDVEVRRDARPPRRLHGNMQAVMAPDGGIVAAPVMADALRRELAWQEGMLSFEDTPLAQAAAQFARYSDRRIAIADPAVGAETVTGRYAANNPEGFARAVALGLDLRVQAGPGEIIIAR